MRTCGVVALSVAAAGILAGIALLSPNPVSRAGSTAVVRASSVSKNTPELGVPQRRSLLVIGASYTAALGATSPSGGYAEVLARELDWPADINAVAGSGYLNPGPNGHSRFAQRINRLPRSLQPGLVLIQGGRNDARYSGARLRSAVCGTVNDVRNRFPGAEVALLGNVPSSVPVSRAQRAVERDLSQASRTCHAPFIDPIAEKWVTQVNAGHIAGRIPGHPNDAGYAYIAHRLILDLADLSDGKIAPATAKPVTTSRT